MPKKDKRPHAEKLADWLGPNTRNFVGTGLSLEEFMAVHDAERLRNSWAVIEPKERRTRMHYVLELAAELHRIKKISIQATAIGELVIEDLITGDYDAMLSLVNGFRDADKFGAERERWVHFVELAEQAHAALTSEGIKA